MGPISRKLRAVPGPPAPSPSPSTNPAPPASPAPSPCSSTRSTPPRPPCPATPGPSPTSSPRDPAFNSGRTAFTGDLRLGRIPDRNGPVFPLNFGHGPTCRPRADLAGAPAVGRRPDGGRTRRPARVDGRTVRRYVDHLIDLDVPVESVRGRYGGYRLAPGYRLPPLMLTDEEALAVLLGLVAGRRAGLMTAKGTASETAAAKIRRVLPERLARRLDAVLGSLAFTAPPGEPAAPDGRSCSPSPTRYAITGRSRSGTPPRRPAQRTHLAPVRAGRPLGPVYVTGADTGTARTGPSGSTASRTPDPARLVRAARRARSGPARVVGLATAPYRHEVVLRIQGTAEQIRAQLPASVASSKRAEPRQTRIRRRALAPRRPAGRAARLAAPGTGLARPAVRHRAAG